MGFGHCRATDEPLRRRRKGARFLILSFPLGSGVLQNAPFGPRAPRGRRKGVLDMPTVMVVDDIDVMRDVLARLLRREGYQTVTAGSGHEAIDVLEHSADPGHAPPDLILLDVKMPDIDGLDLLERLHADNRWKNVPV